MLSTRSDPAIVGLTAADLAANELAFKKEPKNMNHGLKGYMNRLFNENSKNKQLNAPIVKPFDVQRNVKDLENMIDCETRVRVFDVKLNEDGTTHKNGFVSRTNEHHGTLILNVRRKMAGKTYMAYMWYEGEDEPMLCAIPLLESGIKRELKDDIVLMVVPFQRVSLEDASPVKIEPPTDGKARTMFISKLRDVAPEDVLQIFLNDGEFSSEYNIRLIELMMKDRKACLKKHLEMDAAAQALGGQVGGEEENSEEDEVLNRTE